MPGLRRLRLTDFCHAETLMPRGDCSATGLVAAMLNRPLWRKVSMSLELPYGTTSPAQTGWPGLQGQSAAGDRHPSGFGFETIRSVDHRRIKAEESAAAGGRSMGD